MATDQWRPKQGRHKRRRKTDTTFEMNIARTSTISIGNKGERKFVGRSRAGDGTCFFIPELKVRIQEMFYLFTEVKIRIRPLLAL